MLDDPPGIKASEFGRYAPNKLPRAVAASEKIRHAAPTLLDVSLDAKWWPARSAIGVECRNEGLPPAPPVSRLDRPALPLRSASYGKIKNFSEERVMRSPSQLRKLGGLKNREPREV